VGRLFKLVARRRAFKNRFYAHVEGGQVVKALKGVASAANGTGGPRNHLCRLAQKPRRGGQSAAGRGGVCRNRGLLFAVIENAAKHLRPPPRRDSSEPAEDRCPAARGESC
jgi:hypothetical protein